MKARGWLLLLVILLAFFLGLFLGRASLLLGGAVLRSSSGWPEDIVLSRPEFGAPAVARLELNTATAEELQELPGVGPVLAEHILALRQKLGGFTKPEELLQADGVGENLYARIRDLVYVKTP
jgi:competence ComEA-like helix-hairpin-helix protein